MWMMTGRALSGRPQEEVAAVFVHLVRQCTLNPC
jgi:hypothetical protein